MHHCSMVGMIGALAKSKLLLSPKSIDRDYTPAVHTDIPTHHRVPHYIFTSAFNNVMHYMKNDVNECKLLFKAKTFYECFAP